MTTEPAVMSHEWRMINDPNYKEGYNKCLNEAKTWQASQSGQDREGMRWLPLNSESMPERGYDALFMERDGAIFIGRLDKDDVDFIIGNGHWDSVTHWFPMPQKPQQ